MNSATTHFTDNQSISERIPGSAKISAQLSAANKPAWHLLASSRAHDCNDLVELFAQEFAEYRTLLVAGGEEPFYRAARSASDMHQLIFREDFFASALHECAHWCIAGTQRRLLDDFGYWYQAGGRSHEEQNAFYQAEVKSQALEALFSLACGYAFSPSLDNLGHARGDVEGFEQAVYEQMWRYASETPKRAARWLNALRGFYQPRSSLPNSGLALSQ